MFKPKIIKKTFLTHLNVIKTFNRLVKCFLRLIRYGVFIGV